MNGSQNDNISRAKKHTPIHIAGTVALAFLAVFLLVETIQVVESMVRPTGKATNTIVVSGTGKATATPNVATIRYTVKQTATTVFDAQAKTTKIEDTALAVLKKQGISDKDVRTAGYSINPHYVYKVCLPNVICQRTKVSGYDVSQTVSVKIYDLTKIGKVLSGLGSVGVTNLSGPSFAVDDPVVIENSARAKAITNATEQAATLAKELGVRLVRIVHYTQTQNTPRSILYSLNTRSTLEGPRLPVGENEYTVGVSITYEIN